MATLEAIKYVRGNLQILDQLLLPRESKYIPIKDTEDGWTAIHTMQTRGAPAIAIVGSLSLAVELQNHSPSTKKELQNYVIDKMRYLVTARPTAVNMATSAKTMEMLVSQLASQDNVDVFGMKSRIIDALEAMLEKDLNDNRAIGENGAIHILSKISQKPVKMLTHCNTGSLATAGYGTALGVIRSLHSRHCLDHVYCTETRPYNQGSRLTAYELVYEKMPATLICDDMAAALMKSKSISAVVVGADRIAANGDTANKIGTYQLAILAKHHKVPFYVAAPWTTIDLNTENGDSIPIEERSATEITHIMNIAIAAPGIHCWNPAFDITPADLIEGIITEKGVFLPEELHQFNETEIIGGKGDS